jgi:hypothetical protein
VYAIGSVDVRFPTLAVDKEFRQAAARTGLATAGLTDRAVRLKVLQDNRYLQRFVCYVLMVKEVDTYILHPRDQDYQPLLNAYRAEPQPGDLDVMVGVRGPLASSSMCNGLIVPIVGVDQTYSFTRDEILKVMPKPQDADPEKFRTAASEMFDRLMSQSDNAGATDADRVLNYLTLTYPQLYATAARAFADNASFSSVEVGPSRLGSGTRNIVEVRFAFTDRVSNVVSKHFVRVDATEEFPFLVSPLQPYYDRY